MKKHFSFSYIFLFCAFTILLNSVANHFVTEFVSTIISILSFSILSFGWFIYVRKSKSNLDIKLIDTNERLQSELKDREHFEEALYRTENKFKNFVTNSPDGIVLTDESGIITEWNKAASEITGIKREDALGINFWEIRVLLFNKDTENKKFDLEQYGLLLDEGISVVSNNNSLRETDIKTSTGENKIIQIKSFSIPGANGFKVGSIIRDVTEVKYKDRAIQQNAEQLRAIFENTHQAFIFLDTNSIILNFNSIANTRIMNIFDRTLTKGDSILNYFDRSRSENIVDLLAAVCHGENIQTEINLNTNAEQDHWFEFHMAPVFDDDMKVIGIFVNFFDIQIRKMSEKEIRMSLEKERDLNQLKSQFVSSVSHEFRTPLASISSNVQLLQRYIDKWDSTKREITFSRIFESIKHMTSLLQDVSLLGKGQSGMQKFEPRLFDIIEICKQIIDETESSFNRKGRVQFVPEFSNFDAFIDINMTKHIFINLLNNALKYSPDTEIVQFEIALAKPNYLEFTIIDKGIGIAEDDLKNIFEPFVRGNNVGTISGTGLGMAIVKECVDVHNGKIQIESKSGFGTKIVVKLPYMLNETIQLIKE